MTTACGRVLVVLWALSGAAGAACSSPTEPAEAAEAAEVIPAIDGRSAEKAAAAGPDCETLVAEVRQACSDHYAKGATVDCHGLITQTNMAIKQRDDSLFDDPDHKAAGAAAKAGERLCSMTGKRLRRALEKSVSGAPAPACVDLGRYLDRHCFAQIGTPHFNEHCAGTLMVTKRVDSQELCEAQFIAAQQMFE